MRNNNVTKAFTLVELIVVITILAILGTIAFLSMQWYSADARNAKRTSHLKSIENAINVGSTSGTPLLAYASTTANDLTTTSIAWTGTTSTDYKAGPADYSVLGIKQADFIDPLTNDSYVVWVTTKIGWKFEVASINEAGTTKTARVTWNYVKRLAATAVTPTAWSGTTLVTIGDSDINKFKVSDTVTDGTSTWTVTNISADGTKLTLDFNSDGTALSLPTNEQDALVGTASGVAITNNSTNLPY